MSTKPSIVVDPAAQTAPSLTLRRRLNARPEKIYAAWTDPEKMMQWWGPKGHTATSIETDLRVGGRFRAVMFGEGERHEVSGIYKEVVPNQKLVFSWAWISTPERRSQVTISLKPDGDATWLTLTHEQFFDEGARDGHNHGWTSALDKLEELYA